MKKFSNVKEIQAERQLQRSNEIVYSMLGVLIGEIDRLPTREDPTEDQIYTVVNRMYNNAKEMAQYKEQSKVEMEYFEDYIKKQLTVEELTDIIMGLKACGGKNIGDFMKFLTAKYKGQYDGKVASRIINEILKQ